MVRICALFWLTAGGHRPSLTAVSDGVDVLVLAELNPDVLVYGVRPPVQFGQAETVVSGATLTLGSSGAITAAACRAAGLNSAICGVVGPDMLGTLTRALLDDLGVNTAGVLVRQGVTTGMTVVLNDDAGDRALLTHPGAMAALRVADVPADLLGRARHVHVSSPFLQCGLSSGLPDLFDRLRERGISTSLDPGWDPAGRWSGVADLVAHVDLLLPNEAELTAICRVLGLDGDGPDDPPALPVTARRMAERGPTVAVKCGGRGALLATLGHGWEVRQTPVTPIDTTGAGDNFNAGFLAAMLGGADPPAALASGTAAGAVAVLGRGGTGRMATPSELSSARQTAQVRQLW